MLSSSYRGPGFLEKTLFYVFFFFKTDALCWGVLLALAATLIRQPGLALSLGFGVAYLTKHGVRRGSVLIAFLAPFLTLGLLLLYQETLQATTGLPYRYLAPVQLLQDSLLHMSPAALKALGVRSVIAWVYVGLFYLPFMLALMRKDVLSGAQVKCA